MLRHHWNGPGYPGNQKPGLACRRSGRPEGIVYALGSLWHQTKYSGSGERQSGAGEIFGVARQGLNGFGETGYGGPQPPSGTHRYFFHLYALDTDSDMPPGLTRQEIDGVLEGHVIEEAILIGLYTNHEGKRAA